MKTYKTVKNVLIEIINNVLYLTAFSVYSEIKIR